MNTTHVESPTPTSVDTVRPHARHAAFTLALLCVAQVINVLNFQVVAVALPTIRDYFQVAPGQLQWVVSANALAFGGGLLLAGRAGDRYGHRRIFAFGLALLAFASLGCALAPSVALLIGARALQGLGMAMVNASAQALVTSSYPEGSTRNRALGAWGAAGPIGGLLGIVGGGALLDSFGWRAIFWLSVPIAVTALALVPLLIGRPVASRDAVPLDWAGAATGISAVVLFVAGLSSVTQAGGHLWQAGSLVALALGFGALFVLVETRVARPLLPLSFLTQRRIIGATLLMLLYSAVANTPIFFLMIYWQQLEGYGPVQSGLAFLPANLALIVGSLTSGVVSTRWGARRTIAVGLGLLLAGMPWITRLDVGSSYLTTLVPHIVLLGLGLGVAQVATPIAGTVGVGDGEHGLVAGLLNTCGQIGTALGLALLVLVASVCTAALDASAAPSAEALVAGFRWAFAAGAGLAVLGLLITLLVLPKEERH